MANTETYDWPPGDVDVIVCHFCGSRLGIVESICSGGTVLKSTFQCKCGSTLKSTFHPKVWPI